MSFSLQGQISELENNIATLTHLSHTLQLEISAEKKQIATIQLEIPELEQKKKKAAASHLYQEASKYKKEIEAKEAEVLQLNQSVAEKTAKVR